MGSVEHQSDRWFIHMTAEQRAVAAAFVEIFGDELQLCCEKYLEAYKAENVSLPALTPEGNPAKAGGRNCIYTIRKYWESRLRLLAESGFDTDAVRGLLRNHPDPIIQKLSTRL